MGQLVRVLLVGMLVTSASLVHAQSDIEDAVVTADGAMYRGELIEYVPGSHVVLRVSGVDRRFEYSAIVFAGPAERAPDPDQVAAATRAAEEDPPRSPTSDPQPDASDAAPAAAAADSNQAGVPVDVTSSLSGLRLDNLGGLSYAPVLGMGQTGYARIENWMSLCVAPCTTRLMPGTHYFRVVGPDGTVYGRRRGIDIDQAGTLTLGITPRDRKRRWLWATTVLGILGGAAGILVGVRDSLGYPEPRNPQIYPGGLIVGSVLAVAGLGALVTIGVGGGRPSASIVFRPNH